MSIEIPFEQALTVEQAIAAANAAKIGALQALEDIPGAVDAAVGPASASYIAQAVSARDAAVSAKSAAEIARDNALATERRIRTQDIGDFANDADAIAGAAALGVTIVVGSSYWNTTTSIKRICSNSSGTPTFVDEDADAATQRANAQAAAIAAQHAADLAATNGATAGATAGAAAGAAAAAPYVATVAAAASQVASDKLAAQAAAATAKAVSGLSDLSSVARAVMIATDATLFPIDTTRDVYVLTQGRPPVEWRDLSGTSWFTAWGKFPLVAVGVLRTTANTLSIASRSDPTGPVWASWTTAGALAGATYAQGLLRYFGTSGLYTLDFPRDEIRKRDTSGEWLCNNQNIASYNQTTATWTQINSNALPATLNFQRIHMTVLPIAPRENNRCDLARPTTTIGYSSGAGAIIRADGVVVSVTTSSPANAIFDAAGNLWSYRTATGLYVNNMASFLNPSWSIGNVAAFTLAQLGIAGLLGAQTIASPAPNTAALLSASAFAGSNALYRVMLEPGNVAASLWAMANNIVSTGWQLGAQGALKVCLVEGSADLSNLSSGDNWDSNFSQFANTAAFDVAWNAYALAPSGSSYSCSGGALTMTGSASGYAVRTIGIPVKPGTALKITPTFTGTAPNSFRVGSAPYATDGISTTPTSGASYTFYAKNNMAYISLFSPNSAASTVYSSITVTELIGDKSPAASHFQFVGTIGRAVVGAGCERAGFTGFGAANYLVGPPQALASADFDITSEIVNASTGIFQRFWMQGYYNAGSYSGAQAYLGTNASGALFFSASDGTNSATITGPTIVAGQNYTVRCCYRPATSLFEMWVDGRLVGTAARGSVGSLTNASASMYVGGEPSGTYYAAATTIISLFAVSLTSAAPDQIAFMHAQNSKMLVAGAGILLSGPVLQSVVACPDTGQLAVANSTAGVDIFRNFVRVANDNSATGSVNQFPSKAPDGFTFTNGSLGATVSAFASWGGVGYEFVDTAANVSHAWQSLNSYTGDGVTARTHTVPVKAAAKGFAMVYLTGTIGIGVNLATGAIVYSSAGATGAVSALASGEWLISVSGIPAAGAQRTYLYPSGNGTGTGYLGTAAAAIIFGKPMLTIGASVPTAYVEPLSNSPNAKSLAFSGGDLAVATAAGVDFWLASTNGLREAAKVRRQAPFYDQTRGLIPGAPTSNATATDSLLALCPEGKEIDFVVISRCQTVGFATYGTWVSYVKMSRAIGGNVSVDSSTSRPLPGSTTMAVTIAALAANDGCKAVETGLASTNLVWSHDIINWREAPFGQAV